MFTMIMTIDNYLLCDIGNYKIGASKTNTSIFLHVPVKALIKSYYIFMNFHIYVYHHHVHQRLKS